jgi:hypothetical protein
MHPLRYTHRQFGITSFNYKIKMKTLQKNYIMMLWQKYGSLKWIR